ncbi:MAG: hypothetical protein IIZ12_00365 [Eggerthellaceae bacterium]|nr:hypothetical protein [Eggerthellaceae bacterium]
MSEYKPTEYVVDFGDYRSNQFVRLSMALIEQNGAKLQERIVRCRDCVHATISTTGVCKYCEMFVLPDVDGYGADSQVNLPLDFFCGFAKRKEGGDE